MQKKGRAGGKKWGSRTGLERKTKGERKKNEKVERKRGRKRRKPEGRKQGRTDGQQDTELSHICKEAVRQRPAGVGVTNVSEHLLQTTADLLLL